MDINQISIHPYNQWIAISIKNEYHKIDIQHEYHKIDIQHSIVKSWSRSSLCSSLVLLISYISFYEYTSHDDDPDIIPDFVIDNI